MFLLRLLSMLLLRLLSVFLLRLLSMFLLWLLSVLLLRLLSMSLLWLLSVLLLMISLRLSFLLFVLCEGRSNGSERQN
jgi:hypothetical protein